MRKCTNCNYEGEGPFNSKNHCPICGDNTESKEVIKPKVEEVKVVNEPKKSKGKRFKK